MRTIRFIASVCLICVASIACAQWSEQMYDAYTYNSYTNYSAFNQPIDENNYDSDLMEAALFYETNRQRAKYKLPLLKHDANLSTCARNHSMDMVTYNFFSHDSPVPGKTVPQDRLAEVERDGYTACENLVFVSVRKSYAATAKYMVEEKWMKSKGHRANILRANMTHLGCGVAFYRDGDYFYVKATQNFICMN